MLSEATPEHAERAVDLARKLVEAVLGDGAETLSPQALSDLPQRLRSCFLPLCRQVEVAAGDAGEQVVAAVRTVVDADVPPGLMEPQVRTFRLAQGVGLLLGVLDGADPSRGQYEPVCELSAADVSEAVRLARFWQESGMAPSPSIFRDVVGRLRAAIGALVPQVELYRTGLPLSSSGRNDVWYMSADTEDLAGADVPKGWADAVAYAADLAERAEALRGLVESVSEQRIPPCEAAVSRVPGVPVEHRVANTRGPGGRS
ncbi:DUF6415 family natural product biosynthesis protein [Streptomyces sp. NPDC050428]|uniref:DUF6415 family natural product biosynthesis protein n=1 Tax=Streptomyces sp. NPDC050428 TaxID=3155757 RepID=UPI003437048E